MTFINVSDRRPGEHPPAFTQHHFNVSILGIVVRLRSEHLDVVVPRLRALPGADLALDPGDGRLVVVLEDAVSDGCEHSAAATMAAIAQWPEVLNTSLVFEYSGADACAADEPAVADFRAWRGSLHSESPTLAGSDSLHS